MRKSDKLLAECRVEYIVLDGLHQVLIEADVGSPPAIIRLPVAGQGDEPGRGESRVRAYRAGDRVAVHLRHTEVEDHYIR